MGEEQAFPDTVDHGPHGVEPMRLAGDVIDMSSTFKSLTRSNQESRRLRGTLPANDNARIEISGKG